MRVSVVAVRRMRVSVPQRRVHMPMAVRLCGIDESLMWMVMVVVVCMTVFVAEFGVLVKVLVVFAEMQPDSEGHQGAGRDQLQGDGFAEQGDRHHGAHERRDREIGAGNAAEDACDDQRAVAHESYGDACGIDRLGVLADGPEAARRNAVNPVETDTPVEGAPGPEADGDGFRPTP